MAALTSRENIFYVVNLCQSSLTFLNVFVSFQATVFGRVAVVFSLRAQGFIRKLAGQDRASVLACILCSFKRKPLPRSL